MSGFPAMQPLEARIRTAIRTAALVASESLTVHSLVFQLQHEKAELEQHLEQEQEFQVNKLMKKIKKLENDTISKQLTLEQVSRGNLASSRSLLGRHGSRRERHLPALPFLSGDCIFRVSFGEFTEPPVYSHTLCL